MSDRLSRLRANRDRVLERVEAACARAGRAPDSVRLVAVTKYAPWDAIVGLVRLGQVALGENRPQQLVERAERLAAEPGLDSSAVEWHLIGTLQRNKVRPVLPIVAAIHSVDSFRLLERIDSVARELTLSPRVLLEVNISGESAKHGFSADELAAGWEAVERLTQVQVDGLMTMAPLSDDPEAARPVFRGLRELRDRIVASGTRFPLHELSMGMSGDFESAIEEGATSIRVGSLLFEGLDDDGAA